MLHGIATEKPGAAVTVRAADGRLPEDAARLATLAGLALALTPLQEVGQVLDAAGERLGTLLPAARGYVLVWRDEERRLEHQVLFGRPIPGQLLAETPPPTRGLCALTLADGMLRCAPRPAGMRAALAPWELALAAGPETPALVTAPLAAGADARGVLLLATPGDVCDDDLRLVAAAAQAVGGSLGRARAFGSAQREKLAGMGRLTAMLAHEVNNPLQAISNSLHLLLSRPLPEDKRVRYLALAHKEVEQLIGMVRRILDFSRPERDGMRPVALQPAIESVLAATAAQLEECRITVTCEWGTDLPHVSGVASHLKQAFLNLVLAAIEAMPAGGHLLVRTSVAPARDGGCGELVVVELGDTGERVPDDELRAIFEPFSRTRRSSSGVGLPVSYSIIEQHGGRLSAASGDGGTTFRVELPALRMPS